MMVGGMMKTNDIGVWRNYGDVKHLTQPELLAIMVQEAKSQGYVPADTQEDGHPNIYFRAKYMKSLDDGTPVNIWLCDGYWLPCKLADEFEIGHGPIGT